MKSKKMEDLEIMVDNLVIQTNLSIAKQGAMLQITLGVYRETLDKEKYNLIVAQFVEILESYSLTCLKNLEELPIDPDLVSATREQVQQNSILILKQFLQ